MIVRVRQVLFLALAIILLAWYGYLSIFGQSARILVPPPVTVTWTGGTTTQGLNPVSTYTSLAQTFTPTVISQTGRLVYDASCYCYKLQVDSNYVVVRFATSNLENLASTYVGQQVTVSGYWDTSGDMTVLLVQSISATAALLTIELASFVHVGDSMVIRGAVRDPNDPTGPFGLRGVGVTVQITGPNGIDTMTTTTSMMGSWSLDYTPPLVGTYTVTVRAKGIAETATATFSAA